MINIQNIDDNECFKWCLVRYLHPPGHPPARARKVDKILQEKYTIKIRDIHKIVKKKRIASLIVLLVMKTRENIQSICQEAI